EPAALLLALWRRPNDLTDAWEQLPLVLVENLSRRLGVDVRLDPRDREVLALRMRTIARNPADRATLDHVRAFLAARVRLPQRCGRRGSRPRGLGITLRSASDPTHSCRTSRCTRRGEQQVVRRAGAAAFDTEHASHHGERRVYPERRIM